MSLINDALKRANQANRDRQGAPPSTPPMRPAEAEAAGTPKWIYIVIPVLGAALLATGGLLAWQMQGGHSPGSVSTTPSGSGPVAKAATTEPAAPKPAARSELASAAVTASKPKPATTPVAHEPASGSKLPPVLQSGSRSFRTVGADPAAAPAPSTGTQAAPAVSTGTTVAPDSGIQDLKLKAILYNSKRPTALINGKTVQVGDTIEKAVVRAIERSSVTLEAGGSTHILKLPQ